MNSADIDWKSGRIRHWGLDASPRSNIPPASSWTSGGTRSSPPRGASSSKVVKPNDWELPIFRERATTVASLKEQLANAVRTAAAT
jgi:hypothetical protein